MHKEIFTQILSKTSIHPTLIDIGASAGTPDIWKDLSQYAIYIGFDPDLRDIRELSEDYSRGFIINKAVTHQSDKDKLTFYLTKSPYCSSTLPPNTEALSQYIYLFRSLYCYGQD